MEVTSNAPPGQQPYASSDLVRTWSAEEVRAFPKTPLYRFLLETKARYGLGIEASAFRPFDHLNIVAYSRRASPTVSLWRFPEPHTEDLADRLIGVPSREVLTIHGAQVDGQFGKLVIDSTKDMHTLRLEGRRGAYTPAGFPSVERAIEYSRMHLPAGPRPGYFRPTRKSL